MGLLDRISGWFRPEPVATIPDLVAFMDSRAAFMAQKCVVEYARARSGLFSSKLFKEPAFRAALTRSRWTVYGIAFADVAEMVEGLLRHRGGLTPAQTSAAMEEIGALAFASHAEAPECPPGLLADAGRRLTARLAESRLHAPRPVREIPKQAIDEVLESLPIHADLRGHDRVLIQNNLRMALVRIYEEFVAAADLDRLAAEISAREGDETAQDP